MELLEEGAILAPEASHKRACQLGVEASCESKPSLRVDYNDPSFAVDSEWSERALRGLAKISLMSPDADYHGLSPAEADYWIGELSGDVEAFFRPILAKHNQFSFRAR